MGLGGPGSSVQSGSWGGGEAWPCGPTSCASGKCVKAGGEEQREAREEQGMKTFGEQDQHMKA